VVQTAMILIQWIILFGVPFSNEYSYHRRKFNTVEELKRAIITEWQKPLTAFHRQ